MSRNYIPRPDGDFAAYAANFVSAVADFYSTQGLDSDLLIPLKNARDAWDDAYPAHVAAQAAAESARQTKDQARRAFESEMRPVANFVQNFPKTLDSDRATIGLTIKQPTGGVSSGPTTRPVAQIEVGTRLQHTIRISDESTPTKKARPKNTLGAELRAALVSPGEAIPLDPEALRYIALTTNGTATANYPADAGGKTAVYMLRWIGPRGAVGPWSDVATATVAA